MLASQLAMGMEDKPLPERIHFKVTLRRCLEGGIISQRDAEDLDRLMLLRNPLSHYRDVSDKSNVERRAIENNGSAREHLLSDATFAISMVVRLLALPSFRLGDRRTLLDQGD